MKIQFQTDDGSVYGLGYGAAEQVPVANLTVQASQDVRLAESVACGTFLAWAGNMRMQVDFDVQCDGLSMPFPQEVGTLMLESPDGGRAALPNAAVSARRMGSVAGRLVAWHYTVLAGVFDMENNYGSVITPGADHG